MTPPAPFAHAPVMPAEVVARAQQAQANCLLDCTVGGGGHAALLLDARPEATLIGLDRDPRALAAAHARLAPFGARVTLIEATFAEWCEQAAIQKAALGSSRFDFVLADFGASSPQLDCGERGFSFRYAAPLDMRMGTQGETAAQLLARLDENALADLLFVLGQERAARSIARAILRAAPKDTLALARVVRGVKGREQIKRGKTDLATKTFMALRMAVNDELGQVARWLKALPQLVAPGGTAVAISFHSGEDRLVKRAFRPPRGHCTCSPMAAACTCQRPTHFAALTPFPERATAADCRLNPRARSAVLRAAKVLSAP